MIFRLPALRAPQKTPHKPRSCYCPPPIPPSIHQLGPFPRSLIAWLRIGESHAGRDNPLTRHPVVAIITVLIIARRPNVPVARTGGLIEDGDGRWRDVHRKLNSSEGVRSEEGGQHQNQKHCEFVFHI